MSRAAIEGVSRSDLFQVPPEDFWLSVIDFECGPEDPAFNPRNKMPVSEAMVQSIMQYGVLEPVEVIKRDDKLVPIFGNQRIRAAREANKRLKAAGKPGVRVPTKSPNRGSSHADMVGIAIAENEVRQESSALVKAEMAALLLRHHGGDLTAAARAYGLTLPNFKGLLSLREASGPLKKALKSGRVSASAAVEIAKLPPAKQEEKLEGIIAAGGTAEVARTTVRKVNGIAGNSRPTPSLLKQLFKRRDEFSGMNQAMGSGFFYAIGWVVGINEPDENLKEALDQLSKEEQ